MKKLPDNPISAIDAPKVVKAGFDIFMCCSIVVSIYFLFERTLFSKPLWLDEAMLANSILTRNLIELCSNPLDYSQNAPAGYLFIVKLFTIIFGNSENVLRLFSLISFLGVILLTYLVGINLYQREIALFSAAFVATIEMLIRYSAQVKPYASDTFFVLLTIFLYIIYTKSKIKFISLIVVYSITVWLSFAAVFFIAGIISIEIIKSLLLVRTVDDKYQFVYRIALSLIVLFSLLLNYIMWIEPSASSLMQYNDYDARDYWKYLSFPLFPQNSNDIKTILLMINQALLPLELFKTIFTLMAIASMVVIIKSKMWTMIAVYLSVFIILIGSYLGKYPIESRLLLFISPLIIIVSGLSFDNFAKIIKKTSFSIPIKKLIRNAIVIILILCLFVNMYQLYQNTYDPEIKHSFGSVDRTTLRYVESQMNSEDKLYVFFYNIPSYYYVAGYDDYEKHFLEFPKNYNNIIYGSFFAKSSISKPYTYNWEINQDRIENDVNIISKNESVYILITRPIVNELKVIQELINRLELVGIMELEFSTIDTNVYHFTQGKELKYASSTGD